MTKIFTIRILHHNLFFKNSGLFITVKENQYDVDRTIQVNQNNNKSSPQ